MFFDKNKSKQRKPQRIHRSVRFSAHNPSWKSFKINKRRSTGVSYGNQRHPLISIRTPKLIVSYFRLWATRVTYRVLFSLLFVGLFYFLFFSEWLQISNITIEGNKTTDRKLIQDIVEPYLHKKRLSIFPANNYFFIPTGQIEKDISSNFRRISSIKAKRVFPETLNIQIEEKKAVLLFCSNKGCTWVDEEGVSYNKSSFSEAVSDSSEVVIVQDSSESDLPIGDTVTDASYVDFANKLWHEFPDKIKKELAYLSTPMASAQEIRAHTKDGWIVYFDTSVDLNRSLSLLDKVLSTELKNKEEEIKCLDYIDLRITDRVFYKMKADCNAAPSEEQNSPNPEQTSSENVNTNTNTNSGEVQPSISTGSDSVDSIQKKSSTSKSGAKKKKKKN